MSLRSAVLISLAASGSGCGSACVGDGLRVELLDDEAAAPALVNLFFSVGTCDGGPAANLRSGDFELFEDDEPLSTFESQLVVGPAAQDLQLETLLLLDMSGSITDSGALPDLIDAARDYVDAAAQVGKVAVYTFDGRATIQRLSAFTTDVGELHDALDLLTAQEAVDASTNLYGAVVEGLDVLDGRAETGADADIYSGILTLFTDGTHRAGSGGDYPTLGEAKRAVDKSAANVITIGLGSEIDEEVLTDVGKNGYVHAGDPGDLDRTFEKAADQLQDLADSYYSLSYCSPARAGRHALRVEVTDGDLEGHLTYHFNANDFGGGCSTAAGTAARSR